MTLIRLPLASRRTSGTSIFSSPLRYFPVSEALCRLDLLRFADSHDLAAMRSGQRAEIDNVIGLLDRLGIVFDDEDRIPQIAQHVQSLKQPLVVTRMQADARFV